MRGAGLPAGDLLGRVVRLTAGRLVLAMFRTRIHGLGNVPAGGAVLAGNHESYLDPVLLWSGSPRPVAFMAKKELFCGPLGWALVRLWAFPVDRQGADRSALAKASDTVAAGGLVGIFPEGTRRRGDETLEAHGGAAFVALRAGVPIVPVAFVGTERAWPKGRRFPRFVRVDIAFGEPVDPGAFGGSRKERVDMVTAEVMRRIAVGIDEVRRSLGAG